MRTSLFFIIMMVHLWCSHATRAQGISELVAPKDRMRGLTYDSIWRTAVFFQGSSAAVENTEWLAGCVSIISNPADMKASKEQLIRLFESRDVRRRRKLYEYYEQYFQQQHSARFTIELINADLGFAC